MSGGAWGYQQYRIEELTERISTEREVLVEVLKAVARTEHIVDWAECGDTVRRSDDGSGAEKELYDLWLATFEKLYK